MEVQIQQQIIKQPDLVINYITIGISSITFGKNATFKIQLFPEGVEWIDKPIEKLIIIEGQEYLNWKDNDDYIINLICQKLGIQKK